MTVIKITESISIFLMKLQLQLADFLAIKALLSPQNAGIIPDSYGTYTPIMFEN